MRVAVDPRQPARRCWVSQGPNRGARSFSQDPIRPRTSYPRRGAEKRRLERLSSMARREEFEPPTLRFEEGRKGTK